MPATAKQSTPFKIEKNVPRPTDKAASTYRKYPFADMKVEDSFLIKGKATNIRSAASLYARKNGTKFTILKTTGGFRCWRTK